MLGTPEPVLLYQRIDSNKRATRRLLASLDGARQLLPHSVSPVWVALSVVAGPFYMLLLSPLVALLIRQGVSHEREFLADADAVRLTRDPEGLALALAKVSAAHASPLAVGEGCVHLYFVDPLETAPSWLHALFPVLTRLPKDAVVTAVGSEGHFVRVVTKDNVTGYVANSARLTGLTR